jgi:hypothetical protein
MCIIIAGSELLLVEFRGSTPPHFARSVCSAHKDKVEIKCMSSVGGKTPTELKLYLFFSNLTHIEYDSLMLCIISLILTWVIRLER